MVLIGQRERFAREDVLAEFLHPLQDHGCCRLYRPIRPAVQRDPHRCPQSRVTVGEPVAGVEQRPGSPHGGELSARGRVTLRQQHLNRVQPQRAQTCHDIARARQERLNRQAPAGGQPRQDHSPLGGPDHLRGRDRRDERGFGEPEPARQTRGKARIRVQEPPPPKTARPHRLHPRPTAPGVASRSIWPPAMF